MSESYNPYAAPSGGPATPPGPGELGAPQPWAVGEVITTAWDLFKRQAAPLVVAAMIASAMSALPGQIPAILAALHVVEPNSVEYWSIFGVTTFIGQIIGAWINCGMVKIYLDAARGREPHVPDLFSGGARFLPMLGANLLIFLVVFFGMILLIVPGIIAALGLSLTQYYVIDREMGPMEALRASWDAMKGNKGRMFGFMWAAFGIMLLGALACCMGTLAAAPTVGVAMAIIYLRVSGSGAPGAPTPYVPPPSPYGQAPVAAPPPGSPYGY
ncbi:MAG: hypothetical protein ABI175_30075 [Polyangiales bacterium]